MVLPLRRPSICPNRDDLMFLLACFVDNALLDTILQYDAILQGRLNLLGYPSISKCNAKRCNCCMHLCTNSTSLHL